MPALARLSYHLRGQPRPTQVLSQGLTGFVTLGRRVKVSYINVQRGVIIIHENTGTFPASVTRTFFRVSECPVSLQSVKDKGTGDVLSRFSEEHLSLLAIPL